MAPATDDKSYTLEAELTEDCQFLKLPHYKTFHRVLQHLIGKKLEVSFKLLKYVRSEAQNRWLWGVAYVRVQNFLKEATGEKVEKEVIHEYSKQIVWGGKKRDVVAIQREEFLELVENLLDNDKPKDQIMTIIKGNLPHWCVDMQIVEVLGKRVLATTKEVSTKTMTTAVFNEKKEQLQEHWREKDCEIPDPVANNFLSDHVKDN